MREYCIFCKDEADDDLGPLVKFQLGEIYHHAHEPCLGHWTRLESERKKLQMSGE